MVALAAALPACGADGSDGQAPTAGGTTGDIRHPSGQEDHGQTVPEAGAAPGVGAREGALAGGARQGAPAGGSAQGAPAGGSRQGAPAGGARQRGDNDGNAPCVFTAPEGRLAKAEVEIQLDSVSCRQARALARAASLGQPAGANLPIEKNGFKCEPSTTSKGANVTYSCTSDVGSTSFHVVWSRGRG